MFGYFDEEAEKILVSALEIANDLGHGYVGCEHLLLALAMDDERKKAGFLYKAETSYSRLYSFTVHLESVSVKMRTDGSDLSCSLKQALKNSLAYMKEYKYSKIGKNHLLAGLLTEEQTTAHILLGMCGVSCEDIKARLRIRLFEDSPHKELLVSEKISFPTLEKYGKNMTVLQSCERFDPVIGREKEIDQLIRILCKKRKSNPCLVGEAGVGKTAIVEGLAERIVNKTVPSSLRDSILYSFDLSSLVAGTRYRGDFEDRFRQIIKEAEDPRVILFIDEIHTLIGCGGAEGAIDGANILKPALARGSIRFISATTSAEYHQYIEKDAALERRFSKIQIEEPSCEQTLRILEGLCPAYEKHHSVVIPKNVLRDAVYLSNKHIKGRYMPDKVIDLLDETCAMVKLESFSEKRSNSIFRNDLLKVLALQDRLLSELAYQMKKQLICREKQIDAIEKALMADESAPLIFYGKSGSGRHESAKVLAKCLFGSERNCIEIDEISKLSDYFSEKGNVLLFENAEKMHPIDIEKILVLQKRNSFKNSIPVFIFEETGRMSIGYRPLKNTPYIDGIAKERVIVFDEYSDEEIAQIAKRIYAESADYTNLKVSEDESCRRIVSKVLEKKRQGEVNIRKIVAKEIERMFEQSFSTDRQTFH